MGLFQDTVTLFPSPFISSHNIHVNVKTQAAAKSAGWQGRIKTTDEQTAGERPVKESQTVPYYSIFQQLVICLISLLESNGNIMKRERSVWTFFKITPLLFFFLNVWLQGSEAEEPPHLAAIEKLKSEFIFNITFSSLFCQKRQNNNSFHEHHAAMPSADSPKNLVLWQIDGCCAGLNDTEHHCAVLDQTAARERSDADMSVFLRLTAWTHY